MKGWAATLVAAALLFGAADARTVARAAPDRWIASWGSAQMVAEGDAALPPAQAADVTLRQTVRLSAGATRLRLRLSNAFGARPLTIDAGFVARPVAAGRAALAPGGRALRFAGQPQVVIPAGAEVYADPVDLAVAAGGDLSISLHLPEAAAPQTGHPGARATTFVAAGNHVAEPDWAGATTVTRWYAIADVEVAATAAQGTVVTIGDSITDGYGVRPERNSRWPDVLAERLRGAAATRGIGVVNAGIGGNRVLRDGSGPNLLARFDRDVIARSGVRWAILLEGINDIGVLTRDAPATPAQHAALVRQVIGAYHQVVARAHAHGIRVIGGTIMPFGGNGYYHPDAANEADRQAINAAIRAPGLFDAVIDFDRLTRDPARPDRLAPRFDSGDHLHPSEAGYRAMGEAVPLALFSDRSGTGTHAHAPPQRPAIALTFDDIPVHGPLPAGESRAGVIRAITRALADAKAPAFGFLNAGIGTDDPGAPAAVAAWRAAGLPLGNHGFTHLNLDQVGAAAFTADAIRNEAPLAAAAGAGDWHWFRYPFLAEGRATADRGAIRQMLASRGYRVAAVTMGFGDYLWNPPFAACIARRDAAAVARLEASYLADARAAALAARASAQARLGRDIPYVLLMHVGAFDARMLPRLLALYRSLGFRFVTLAEAEADPFYAAALDLAGDGPSPSLAAPPAAAPLAGPPAGLCL